MKLSFPSGWGLGSTVVWTFTVVVAFKVASWAIDTIVAPAIAGAMN